VAFWLRMRFDILPLPPEAEDRLWIIGSKMHELRDYLL
jgi:hypothetical protein